MCEPDDKSTMILRRQILPSKPPQWNAAGRWRKINIDGTKVH
jgi:hypothetical protein